MKTDDGFQTIKDIFTVRASRTVKPPAYEWQELALRIIKELGVPNFKRNSVFKICKTKSKTIIEQSLNDTKELCRTGDKWKYFFKIIGQ